MTNGRQQKQEIDTDEFSTIAELVQFAKADSFKSHQEIKLGTFRNSTAQQICSSTGVQVRDVKRKLNAHGIRHAFNTHGDEAKESLRKQACVIDEDFELIPEILNNPDNYERGDNSKKGQDAIVFTKQIKGRIYYVIMSVTRSRGIVELVFNTMYIKK